MKKEWFRYWWTLLYFPVYMFFFLLAERLFTEDVNIIHMALDDVIPFCEWFIIPYYLWFPFMAIFFVWIFFGDKEEYVRFVKFLYSGMTVFILISYLYPNGLLLRPEELPRENIATHIVEYLYRTDTSTNVFPSIHVFNTLGVMIAVAKSKRVMPSVVGKWAVELFGVLIILSTVFLKQHSVWDVLGALAFGVIFYLLYYYLPGALAKRKRLAGAGAL